MQGNNTFPPTNSLPVQQRHSYHGVPVQTFNSIDSMITSLKSHSDSARESTYNFFGSPLEFSLFFLCSAVHAAVDAAGADKCGCSFSAILVVNSSP